MISAFDVKGFAPVNEEDGSTEQVAIQSCLTRMTEDLVREQRDLVEGALGSLNSCKLSLIDIDNLAWFRYSELAHFDGLNWPT